MGDHQSHSVFSHFDVLSHLYAKDFEATLDVRPTVTVSLKYLYSNEVGTLHHSSISEIIVLSFFVMCILDRCCDSAIT